MGLIRSPKRNAVLSMATLCLVVGCSQEGDANDGPNYATTLEYLIKNNSGFDSSVGTNVIVSELEKCVLEFKIDDLRGSDRTIVNTTTIAVPFNQVLIDDIRDPTNGLRDRVEFRLAEDKTLEWNFEQLYAVYRVLKNGNWVDSLRPEAKKEVKILDRYTHDIPNWGDTEKLKRARFAGILKAFRHFGILCGGIVPEPDPFADSSQSEIEKEALDFE